MKHQLLIYIVAILFLTSCLSVGPIIPYNKEIRENQTDTTIVHVKRMNYFCFDYNKDFECDKEVAITTDDHTGVVLERSVVKSSNLRMRGGRRKIRLRIIQYDSTGAIKKKIKQHYQNFGRFGRVRKRKEIEYLPNGQKRISLLRGTLRNPNKLEKVRYRGNKFKRRDD